MRDLTDAETATSPWSPRVAGFLLAEAVSAIGTFATMIAIWAYAAYQYDASPGEISLYGLAFSAPGVVLGPLAGVVVDRFGPRTTLLGAKALGVLASLALLGAHDFRMLTVLSALHGVGGAFARPALQSLPPRRLPDEQLARTNALVGLTDQLALVLGPVAAGVAIGAFGFGGAFIFDAATYALGIVVLPILRLRPVEPDGVDAAGRDGDPESGGAWHDRSRVGTSWSTRPPSAASSWPASWSSRSTAPRCWPSPCTCATSSSDRRASSPGFRRYSASSSCSAASSPRGWAIAWRRSDGSSPGSSLQARPRSCTSEPTVSTSRCWVWRCGARPPRRSGGRRGTVLQRSSPPAAHGRVMAADMLAGNLAMFIGLALAGTLIGTFGVRSTILALGAFVITSGVALGVANSRDHDLRSVTAPATGSSG